MAADQICPNCGFEGKPKQTTKGSFALEAVLWLLIVPGLLYSLWRLSSKTLGCPTCGAPNMVPLNSPRGKQLKRDLGAMNWTPDSPR